MPNQYNLQRFIDRQKEYFPTALKEIQNGRKQSHWIWWIFPQLKELGYSSISKELSLDTNDPYKVMGSPDDKKLCSSMTLFLEADPDNKVFKAVLDKYYGGVKDSNTLDILFYNT